jgi:hypothetical protein
LDFRCVKWDFRQKILAFQQEMMEIQGRWQNRLDTRSAGDRSFWLLV